MRSTRRAKTVCISVLLGGLISGLILESSHATEVHAQLVPLAHGHASTSLESGYAAIWLEPLKREPAPPIAPGKFTLLQKNKTFIPHILVVPVGSNVSFPNADPFFHNVFSLFDGKRFDLGLYEAGATRTVSFSRLGVSYIFCNIHSQMSAVVIAIDTPYYSTADEHGVFHVKHVPDGDYNLHIWAEGQPQVSLDQMTRRVHIEGEIVDLGEIHAGRPSKQHLNKFGKPYEPDAQPPY
jgi:hypothetical protein